MMKIKELPGPSKQMRDPHPSIAQRKKLDEARKQRLAGALRGNLQKRKEQMRARKQRGSDFP